MRDLGTKHLLVAGFVLVLINSIGGSDACLADPTDEHAALFSIPKPSEEADAAADKGKTNLIKFIQNDPKRAASIGFSSEDEVTSDKMSLGSGIPVIKIVAESLLGKPDFKNMSAYLEPLNQFMYPITVDGKPRAAIYVQKLKKTSEWKTVSFGAPGLVSALEELKLLGRDGVFIAQYYPLGIWLACTGLDDKSQCHQITANPKAFDYKTKHKVWPKRGPVKREPIGAAESLDAEAETARAGAEGGLGRAEAPGPRAEAGVGRAEPPEPPGARAEAGVGRPEAPGPRAEAGVGRAEPPGARAETEVGRDKDEEIPLVNIGKVETGATVLRSLADKTRKMPYLDDKTSRLKNR